MPESLPRPAWMVAPTRDDGTPTDPRWRDLVILPDDYATYGGLVERWAEPGRAYPDCSCSCKHFRDSDGDWGICARPDGYRFGLLTWEHQAGAAGGPDGGPCFEPEDEDAAEDAVADRIEVLKAEIARLRAAAIALITAYGGWEQIWLDNMRGRLGDSEYAALQVLGAFVGMPDSEHEALAARGQVEGEQPNG